MTTQYPPQYPPYVPQPAPAPAKKGRVHWLWLIAVFFAGLMFGSIGDTSPSQTAASAPTRAAQAPAVVQPVPQTQEAPQAPAGPDFSQGVPSGEWMVPNEVAPGKYRSTGSKQGLIELCSASVHKEGELVEWKTGGVGEQVLVTIPEGATSFRNTNCEPFVKVG